MAEIFPFMSREYGSAFAVQKYALLDMPLQRAGEHRTFDIATCGGAVFGAQGMRHSGNVLLNGPSRRSSLTIFEFNEALL
jgi:hypothetical protein